MKIQINKDRKFIPQLKENLLKNEKLSSWELFYLAYRSEKTRMIPHFHGLCSIKYLPHLKFLPHQIKTAQIAIEKMDGRAILADEVGLGKTIEAGLILKEYMVRNLVKKALILVPASLTNQWIKELKEKFFIQAIPYQKNISWAHEGVIVASIDTAKRPPHREKIEKNFYDFVLVDEAHILKNEKTINYSFVRSIQKKYCLLLTATPIQNKLIEIFNLITILKPGHLGDYQSFMKKYSNKQNFSQQNKYLKKLIQQVMIRHTRKSVKMNPVERKIQTIWLDFTEEEKKLYKRVHREKNIEKLTKVTYLRELCSSHQSFLTSLNKQKNTKIKRDFLESIEHKTKNLPQHIKAKKMIELIQSLQGEKAIVFTEYRTTQIYLQWILLQHGIKSVPFQGDFKTSKKDWMRELFKDNYQVLIATEAGGHGINLQFCHHLINYDLPWNPMKLEQRIGRIHRYGQKKDVHIYNFALRNTIEEHIIKLLYEKIHLFENVIGELDAILQNLKIKDIEKEIMNIHSNAQSQEEEQIKMRHLSEIIQQNIYKITSEDS